MRDHQLNHDPIIVIRREIHQYRGYFFNKQSCFIVLRVQLSLGVLEKEGERFQETRLVNQVKVLYFFLRTGDRTSEEP